MQKKPWQASAGAPGQLPVRGQSRRDSLAQLQRLGGDKQPVAEAAPPPCTPGGCPEPGSWGHVAPAACRTICIPIPILIPIPIPSLPGSGRALLILPRCLAVAAYQPHVPVPPSTPTPEPGPGGVTTRPFHPLRAVSGEPCWNNSYCD